jgi:hypothetical protein
MPRKAGIDGDSKRDPPPAPVIPLLRKEFGASCQPKRARQEPTLPLQPKIEKCKSGDEIETPN